MNIHKLHQALSAVCPIDGVSVGRSNDKSTWRVDYSEAATVEQKNAAFAVIEAFDVSTGDTVDVVTMRQARLALLQAGLLTSVEAAINGMSGEQGAAARIEWEYSATLERGFPLVTALSAQLGLSDAQLDQLFALAWSL